MGIASYIKEIGRGKEGARSLSREQSADLLGQILDGQVSDLEMGAFCIAMRIKGETPQEMAGFLDAVHARLAKVNTDKPVIVIPSYNGARKLPGLTMLLAALLARQAEAHGFTVLVHGCTSETSRVPTQAVYEALLDTSEAISTINSLSNGALAGKKSAQSATNFVADYVHSGALKFCATQTLSPALERLLQVRRTIGLRNSAHSLVKLMNPCNTSQALIVTSYTHPEYLLSMTEALKLTGSHALLLRGTEGESVADPRRRPRMDGFVHGQPLLLCEAQEGSLMQLPQLPSCDAVHTAAYIHDVLQGKSSVPAPIAAQVEHILLMMKHMTAPQPV